MAKPTSGSSRSRPQPKTFLTIEQENAYARLGISPLASTEQIAARITELRGKALKMARTKSIRGLGKEEEEILRLQKIEEEIGKSEARALYDERHPQSVLLTVQPSLTERAWQRDRRAGLISDWLCDEFGEESFLPSLSCLKLWSPGGLEDEVVAILAKVAESENATGGTPESGTRSNDAGRPLSSDDLIALLKEQSDV